MSISFARRVCVVAAVAALFSIVSFLAGGGGATADPYPPRVHCAILTSTVAVAPGSAVTIAGSGFAAHAAVHLSIAGTSLGSVRSNASGGFTTSVDIPASVGRNRQIVASAASGTCSSDASADNADAMHADSSGAGDTASTGFPAATALAAGLVLLGGGAMIALIGRRRRAT